MIEPDLPSVDAWLHEPHVARWWTNTSPEAEIADYRRRVAGRGAAATVMLMITEDDRPVGWCQWYRWDRYPEEAEAMGALPAEVGIDYAIGEPTALRRGVGTEMVAALVAWVRRHEPGAGVLVDPDAANVASRRVLERNGFELVAVRAVASEPSDNPMAIYRLPGESVKAASGGEHPSGRTGSTPGSGTATATSDYQTTAALISPTPGCADRVRRIGEDGNCNPGRR
jgi:aminoglycoside 6'-N-acetyltransferase